MENINDILNDQGGGNNRQQNDNKKRIALISVISAVAVVVITVVGVFALNGKPRNNNTVPDAGTTMQGVPTTEAAAAPEGDGAKADIGELAKNIEINGNKISLPCTVKQMADALGNEWNYPGKEDLESREENTQIDFRKGSGAPSPVVACVFDDYNSDIQLEQNLIDTIVLFPSDLQSFSLDWITTNTKREEIENRYGKMQIMNNKEETDSGIIMFQLNDINSDSKSVIFGYNQGSLESIMIEN